MGEKIVDNLKVFVGTTIKALLKALLQSLVNTSS